MPYLTWAFPSQPGGNTHRQQHCRQCARQLALRHPEVTRRGLHCSLLLGKEERGTVVFFSEGTETLFINGLK